MNFVDKMKRHISIDAEKAFENIEYLLKNSQETKN